MKRVDVWDSLEDRGLELRKSGSKYAITNCPLPDHDDTNPSFSINLTTGKWRCFGCHQSGDFKELISLLDGTSEEVAARRVYQPQPVSEYKRKLTEFLDGVSSEKQVKYFSMKSFKATFPSVYGTPGEDYLQKRGINGTTIDRFCIRWGGGSGLYRGRVVVPIRTHEGKLLSFVGRVVHGSSKPKTRKARPAASTVFGLYELIQDQGLTYSIPVPKIVCVEGEFDAMYLQENGIPAVSIMGTSNMNSSQMRLIRHFAKSAVLLYDGDEAGRTAVRGHYDNRGNYRQGHGRRLSRYMPTMVYDLPDGVDPNDMGPDQIDELRSFLEA